MTAEQAQGLTPMFVRVAEFDRHPGMYAAEAAKRVVRVVDCAGQVIVTMRPGEHDAERELALTGQACLGLAKSIERLRQVVLDHDGADDPKGVQWDRIRVPIDTSLRETAKVLRMLGGLPE